MWIAMVMTMAVAVATIDNKDRRFAGNRISRIHMYLLLIAMTECESDCCVFFPFIPTFAFFAACQYDSTPCHFASKCLHFIKRIICISGTRSALEQFSFSFFLCCWSLIQSRCELLLYYFTV